jgi:hypothetical protein
VVSVVSLSFPEFPLTSMYENLTVEDFSFSKSCRNVYLSLMRWINQTIKYNIFLKRYNWEQPDWPTFKYSLSAIEDDLFLFAEKTGKVTGSLNALPDETKMEAVVEMMVSEAIKTSEIEGEFVSRKDVRSSIKNNLGLNSALEKVKDKQAAGIGELMIDVRNSFK